MTVRGKQNLLKRILLFQTAFCILLLFCTVPGDSCAAAKKARLWISSTGEYTTDAIDVFTEDGKAFFFLPGNICINCFSFNSFCDILLRV